MSAGVEESRKGQEKVWNDRGDEQQEQRGGRASAHAAAQKLEKKLKDKEPGEQEELEEQE